MSHRAGGTNKPWSEKTYDQKRHAIHAFLVARTPAFWLVCGKDAQKRFDLFDVTPDNIDTLRDDIVNMYRHCLVNAKVTGKDNKIKYMEGHLLK